MKFGRRAAEAPERDSNNTFIRRLKKGDNRVRILQEIDDWIEYYEHFNPEGFSFPCTGERSTCPGCTSNNDRMKKASRRYATNALRNGYVEVIQIPSTLKDRLVTRSERNGGTLLDRDFTLIKSGDMLETEYDYDQEPKSQLDLSMYAPQMHDIEALLRQQFREAWPDIDIGDEPTPPQKPQNTRQQIASAARPHQDGAAKPADQDPPPSEPAAEKDQPRQEQNGSAEVTVDDLQNMKLWQIHQFLDNDPEVENYPEDLSKPELIDWIVEHFSE